MAEHNQKKTSSSDTSPSEPTVSPEILFLIKAQAKATAKINALQKKVEQLEQTISQQRRNESTAVTTQVSSASASAAKLVNSSNPTTSKERIAISDDSGGEYSRATTTSDDDELSLLLDQIARRSQQLQSIHQVNSRFANLSIGSSVSVAPVMTSGVQVMSQTPHTMQFRSQRHPFVTTTGVKSYPTRSPVNETLVEQKFNNFSNPTLTAMSAMAVSGGQASAPPMLAQASQLPYNESISALLFEPNVDNVLKNLDDIISGEAIDSNKFSTASTLSQTYQRSQTSQHSSQSLYDNVGLPSAPQIRLTGSSASPSSNWQLERAKTLVKQREERELDKQMRLNEEWLQTQLKAEPKQAFRRTNYIDSLKPTFR